MVADGRDHPWMLGTLSRADSCGQGRVMGHPPGHSLCGLAQTGLAAGIFKFSEPSVLRHVTLETAVTL